MRDTCNLVHELSRNVAQLLPLELAAMIELPYRQKQQLTLQNKHHSHASKVVLLQSKQNTTGIIDEMKGTCTTRPKTA